VRFGALFTHLFIAGCDDDCGVDTAVPLLTNGACVGPSNVTYTCEAPIPIGEGLCSFSFDNKAGINNSCAVSVECPNGSVEEFHIVWAGCAAPLVTTDAAALVGPPIVCYEDASTHD